LPGGPEDWYIGRTAPNSTRPSLRPRRRSGRPDVAGIGELSTFVRRMSISQGDIKILFGQSGGVCAFPECGGHIVQSATGEDEAVLLAHVAHIVAESPAGPRGNSPLSLEDRNKHPNLLVLCTEHHTIVDKQTNTYSVAVLKQMKLDHEIRIRQATSVPAMPKSQLSSETIYSTLLPVTHLPAAVFAVPCDLDDDRMEEVRLAIKYPEDRWELIPFLLKGRTLFAFQDLTDPGNPFRNTIDHTKARAIRTTDFWSDPEGQRRFVTLLNRSLYKYTARFGERFDPDHRRYYFPPDQVGKTRRVRYRTRTGRSHYKKVVWQPITKLTGEPKKHWRHLAAALRFHRVADRQWCLSIRPERRLTQDGEVVLASEQIGRRVTRLKARMYNDVYLGEVHFWRNYLSRDGRRIMLSFGAQIAVIDWTFLEFNVTSPGIPGDSKPFINRPPDDDLFSSLELDIHLTGADPESEDEEGENDAEDDDE
jgi:hypothetical protein